MKKVKEFSLKIHIFCIYFTKQLIIFLYIKMKKNKKFYDN